MVRRTLPGRLYEPPHLRRGRDQVGCPPLPGWSATITVPGEDARFAAEQATSLVETWAAKSGLPAWPVVRVDAVEASILDRELAEPNYPELVGIAELAELAGVSQQRASVLASRPDFPKPIARLRSGPVFDLRQVSSLVEKWSRRPSRPAKAKQRARV
jgi:hypothetical protein